MEMFKLKKQLIFGTALSISLILAGCGDLGTATSSEDSSSDKTENSTKTEKEEKALAEVVESTHSAWKPYEDSEYTYIHSAALYENKGNVPVRIGETQMNHKGTDGSILATETMVYSVPEIILPGEKAIIVETSYVEGITAEAFGETTYNFTFDETDENPNIMEISGVKGVPTEDGYKVTGVVKNITDQQQNDVRLAAILLDAEGNLLGALNGSVDVGIAPNGEAGFELSYPEVPLNIIDKVATVEVKSYAWNW